MKWLGTVVILAIMCLPYVGCGPSYMSEEAAQKNEEEDPNEYAENNDADKPEK